RLDGDRHLPPTESPRLRILLPRPQRPFSTRSRSLTVALTEIRERLPNVIFTYKGTGTMAQASAPVPEKEATYPENRMFGNSLPAYGLYARHVKNLVCQDFRFNLGAPDARPAVLLDDCHNVRLTDFDTAAPSNDQPLVRLIQSTNVALCGYQSVTPIAKFLLVEGKASSGIKLTGNDLTGVRSIITLGQEGKDSAVQEWNNLK
ncbi:MAG: hypothetical protein NTZ17_21830, partial [Phycisphaerae bacterium]|nr:hypothetical protein [Phycisphaerae bacterium]